MRTVATSLVMLALAAPIAAAQPSENEVKRINEAAAVIRELHTTPDKDIPQSIWDKAKCVIVVPGLKRAAFVFGGEYGKGVASCRKSDGAWTSPSFVQIAKGTWGAQIGAAEVDLVMLVTNDRGVEKMLRNKVTLGAEASAAAGPVGRDAQAATDAQLQAEILAWSRSRGLFAGVNVGGGQLSPDEESNRNLYGRAITAREILVDGKAQPPAAAKPFADALREHDVPKRTAR